MLDEVFKELRTGIEKAIEALRRDLSKVRTGRAHAGMLDSLRVDYYGVPTPVGQMATVSVPEPRLITIKPWEKGQVKHIEKAIRESDLGLNPQTDGEIIGWFRKVRRYDNSYTINRKVAARDVKGPLPKVIDKDDKDSVQTRMLSLLNGQSGVKTDRKSVV